MTRVFKIGFELQKFQHLVIDAPDVGPTPWSKVIRQDGRPRSETWHAPPVYSPEPLLEKPDFWHLFGCPGLVADARVSDLVGPPLLAAGELLPLPFGDEMFHVSNVTGVYDCIDDKHLERTPAGAIVRYPFIEHRLPETTLFKIPQSATTQVFCVTFEGEGELALDFKLFVERHSLTGLRFEEVWNSEAGPIKQDPLWFLKHGQR